MLTILVIAVTAYLFARGISRMREDQAGSTHRRPGDVRRPADGSAGWKPFVGSLKQRLGVPFAVAAGLGCVAVVAGGLAWGLWGLAGGTLLLAGGLGWVATRRPGFRFRRPRSGELTDDERLAFEQIVANLTADD